MKHSQNYPKVFGIGLNKTGTTTLGLCAEILGLSSKNNDKSLLEDVVVKKDFTRIKEAVAQYDLFQDWPWPLIYKEMDQMYPGSKFILTLRSSEEKWFRSLKNHSMTTDPKKHCRKLAYGYDFPHKHEEEHLEIYRNHLKDVRSYFQGREGDFIELCWENGDGFQELCKFLNYDVPDVPFPHAGKSEGRQISKERLQENLRLRGISDSSSNPSEEAT